ncbi:MAG: hypothetical protein AAF192_18625 [Pseudomonadota bacterium]
MKIDFVRGLAFGLGLAGMSATGASAVTVTGTSGDVTTAFIGDLGTGVTDLETAGDTLDYRIYRESLVTLSAADVASLQANANGAIVDTSGLAEGQAVQSFIVAMKRDPSTTRRSGTIQFDGSILAVITSAGHSSGPVQGLQNTDAPFGVAGVNYDQSPNPTFRGTLEQSTESVALVADLSADTIADNTIRFDMISGGAGGLEQFRVIVSAIPVPAGALLILSALGLAAGLRRRAPAA